MIPLKFITIIIALTPALAVPVIPKELDPAHMEPNQPPPGSPPRTPPLPLAVAVNLLPAMPVTPPTRTSGLLQQVVCPSYHRSCGRNEPLPINSPFEAHFRALEHDRDANVGASWSDPPTTRPDASKRKRAPAYPRDTPLNKRPRAPE